MKHLLKRLRSTGAKVRSSAGRVLLRPATPIALEVCRRLATLHDLCDTRLSWYDHIYDHLRGPENWIWLERGILASEHIEPDDLVLDLCCGDGSYTGIFYSKRAAAVDALDLSPAAIRVGRRRWGRSNVAFQVSDVLRDPFPRPRYDVVILNAALEYMSIEDGHRLLERILAVLSPERGLLFGFTPVWEAERSLGYGQVSTLTSVDQLDAFLRAHFGSVHLRRSRETTRLTYYFVCRPEGASPDGSHQTLHQGLEHFHKRLSST